MELYLIRHAQSQNNAKPQEQRVEDPGITDVGHQQAENLAKWIPRLNLTKLITSPFLRTLQTTEYLWKATDLRPEVRTDLHEVGGCVSGPSSEAAVGEPGMNRSTIEEKFPFCEVEPSIDGDGWWNRKPYESMTLAEERAQRLVGTTLKEFSQSEERVAYVMHADFKVIFLSQFHQQPLQGPYNVSVSKVVMADGGLRLADYNQIHHLPEHLVTL